MLIVYTPQSRAINFTAKINGLLWWLLHTHMHTRMHAHTHTDRQTDTHTHTHSSLAGVSSIVRSRSFSLPLPRGSRTHPLSCRHPYLSLPLIHTRPSPFPLPLQPGDHVCKIHSLCTIQRHWTICSSSSSHPHGNWAIRLRKGPCRCIFV